MRKLFRVIYLLAMPLLFVALLAICLSFNGVLTMETATTTSTEAIGTVGIEAKCFITLQGVIFDVENWYATLNKTFQYTINILSMSIELKDVTATDPLGFCKDPTITLQLLSAIGIVVFGIGFFISEVGYGSKLATVLGALILIGGSACIFFDADLNEGLHYILNLKTVQNGEEVIQEVINFKLDWLTIKLVAGIADGLTLLNVLFVLLRRKKA